MYSRCRIWGESGAWRQQVRGPRAGSEAACRADLKRLRPPQAFPTGEGSRTARIPSHKWYQSPTAYMRRRRSSSSLSAAVIAA